MEATTVIFLAKVAFVIVVWEVIRVVAGGIANAILDSYTAERTMSKQYESRIDEDPTYITKNGEEVSVR